jgi:hypothetical protein
MRIFRQLRTVLILVVALAQSLWAGVVISEIMYHPAHAENEAEDTRHEWIELFNGGDAIVLLAGWRFSDGVSFTFPAVAVSPGRYIVVAADPDGFSVAHPEVSVLVGGWDGRLRNSGERVELTDASGDVVDVVRYADEGQWAVRELGPEHYGHRGWQWRDDHDGGGKSLELVDIGLPNEYGPNWGASVPFGGTPGAANSVEDDASAPLIVRVEHEPAIPSPADPVTVSARVVARDGLPPRVHLYYRVDRSAYVAPDSYPAFEPADFAVVEMRREVAHAAGVAQDGTYAGYLPPAEDGSVVEFFVEAVDESGRRRRWPAPSLVDGTFEQVANALYIVDAAIDPAYRSGGGTEGLRYLVMTQAERGRLARIGSHHNESFSRARMNATFISLDAGDEQVRYNVGVRNRGKGSRRPPPNNYRVDFPNDGPWQGRTAINLNSKHTYLQCLGHGLFREAGLPALEAARVQVRVNGSNPALDDPERTGGSYVQLDAYDGDCR